MKIYNICFISWNGVAHNFGNVNLSNRERVKEYRKRVLDSDNVVYAAIRTEILKDGVFKVHRQETIKDIR